MTKMVKILGNLSGLITAAKKYALALGMTGRMQNITCPRK